MTCLVWLQRDLRLKDQEALTQAVYKEKPFVVAYFHDPSQIIGEANALRLSYSLTSLQKDIAKLGGRLLMPEGRHAETMTALLQHFNIDEVLYHYEVGHNFQQGQQTMLELCQQRNIRLTPFDQAWYQYEDILSQKGGLYSVFTPFYKKLLTKLNHVALPLKPVSDLSAAYAKEAPSEWLELPPNLQQLQLQPWAQPLIAPWRFGEEAAWQDFDRFCQTALNDYPEARDFPAQTGTSLWSIPLHFGELSARSVLYELQALKTDPNMKISAIDSIIRQLSWREFARYLLHFHPQLEQEPFQQKFNSVVWNTPNKEVEKWRHGQTGIPIIDAAMRQLWQTGWQHNRVRMLCASWLSKNLHQDWRLGQAWYADTLMDADPANNTMGWQWVAGCGVDAAPYYRLFNPVIQSEKFDPQGEYIKHWIPELKSIPAKQLHAPWKHPQAYQTLGVQLGQDYPLLALDLDATRKQHLSRVEAHKSYT